MLPPLLHTLTAEQPPEHTLISTHNTQFAAIRNGAAGITKEEALAGKRVPGAVEGSFAGVFASKPVVTAKNTSTFEEVRAPCVSCVLYKRACAACVLVHASSRVKCAHSPDIVQLWSVSQIYTGFLN